MMIARALFTESLWLARFAQVGELRDEYVLGWVYNSWKQAEALFADHVATAEKKDELLQQMTRKRRGLQEHLRSLGKGSLKQRRLGDEHALVRDLGLEDEYRDFRYFHHAVHGTELAHMAHRFRREDGVFGVSLTTPNPKMLLAIATSVARSSLRAHVATARMFDWAMPAADVVRIETAIDAAEASLSGGVTHANAGGEPG